jgi:hypothetical protein
MHPRRAHDLAVVADPIARPMTSGRRAEICHAPVAPDKSVLLPGRRVRATTMAPVELMPYAALLRPPRVPSPSSCRPARERPDSDRSVNHATDDLIGIVDVFGFARGSARKAAECNPVAPDPQHRAVGSERIPQRFPTTRFALLTADAELLMSLTAATSTRWPSLHTKAW